MDGTNTCGRSAGGLGNFIRCHHQMCMFTLLRSIVKSGLRVHIALVTLDIFSFVSAWIRLDIFYLYDHPTGDKEVAGRGVEATMHHFKSGDDL